MGPFFPTYSHISQAARNPDLSMESPTCFNIHSLLFKTEHTQEPSRTFSGNSWPTGSPCATLASSPRGGSLHAFQMGKPRASEAGRLSRGPQQAQHRAPGPLGTDLATDWAGGGFRPRPGSCWWGEREVARDRNPQIFTRDNKAGPGPQKGYSRGWYLGPACPGCPWHTPPGRKATSASASTFLDVSGVSTERRVHPLSKRLGARGRALKHGHSSCGTKNTVTALKEGGGAWREG